MQERRKNRTKILGPPTDPGFDTDTRSPGTARQTENGMKTSEIKAGKKAVPGRIDGVRASYE